jgi:hypothetical protein
MRVSGEAGVVYTPCGGDSTASVEASPDVRPRAFLRGRLGRRDPHWGSG